MDKAGTQDREKPGSFRKKSIDMPSVYVRLFPFGKSFFIGIILILIFGIPLSHYQSENPCKI